MGREVAELSTKELEQAIVEKKEQDAIRFHESAWELALAVMDGQSGEALSEHYASLLTDRWNNCSVRERVQVMEKYRSGVADKIRWALDNGLDAVEGDREGGNE